MVPYDERMITNLCNLQKWIQKGQDQDGCQKSREHCSFKNNICKTRGGIYKGNEGEKRFSNEKREKKRRVGVEQWYLPVPCTGRRPRGRRRRVSPPRPTA